MNATLVIMQQQQALARIGRADVKPRWRKTESRPARKDGVRQHTARLRDVRYN